MQIQNPEVTRLARSVGGLTLSEGYPQNLMPDVRAVIDLTPRTHRVTDILKAATGAATLYTTPMDRDFFMTVASMQGSKAATDSGTALTITATVNGVSVTILSSIFQTLHDDTFQDRGHFFYPIKVDRGTAVVFSLGGTWTGARAQIQGYEVTS